MSLKFPKTPFELTKMIGRIAPADLGLKANEKYLLLQLSVFFDEDFSCFPSLNTLAEHTGWSVPTVSTNLKGLIKSGIIKKLQTQLSSKNYENNVYQLDRKMFAKLTGLEIVTNKQVLAPPTDESQEDEVARLYSMFTSGKKLTKQQASFLLDSNKPLSSVERHQLTLSTSY